MCDCAAVNQVVNTANVDGTLHVHHCSNGNGDHGDEWHRHVHDHSQQLSKVLIEENVARCFKHGNEVTEDQATTRTKVRRARENATLITKRLQHKRRKQQSMKVQTETTKKNDGRNNSTEPAPVQPNSANTASGMTAAQCAGSATCVT